MPTDDQLPYPDQQNTPEEEHSLDELAKGLADGTISRRRALKMLAGALFGGSLLALIPGAAGASARAVAAALAAGAATDIIVTTAITTAEGARVAPRSSAMAPAQSPAVVVTHALPLADRAVNPSLTVQVQATAGILGASVHVKPLPTVLPGSFVEEQAIVL